MQPHEFRAAREKMGLSVNQLGEMLDTNPTTIRRWEMNPERSTARPPNPVASQVMRWMLAGYMPPRVGGNLTNGKQ